MVHDLKFPIDVVVGPTVRDPDGLALSSRNCFLSPEDRTKALALSRALNAGAAELSAGGAVEVVEKVMWDLLAAGEGVEPSYARVVDRHSFEVPEGDTGMVLVVAARVGGVRLIDNVEVKS